MSALLTRWNALAPAAAAAEVLPCNGSKAWAQAIASKRPITSEQELHAAADAAWQSLPEQDQLQAFATHPRIGDRHSSTASAQSLLWSGKEQAAAQETRDALPLQQANQAYEVRFGRTFLICATGLTRAQILASLQQRMLHTPQQELAEAAEQQRLITRLRLTRWLEGN